MKILSITAQKPDSTGSGVFLTELVNEFASMGHEQAVIAGIYEEDQARLPEGTAFFPVVFSGGELPYPIVGMSDEMPYKSTRYRDMTEEMTAGFERAFKKTLRRAVKEFQPDLILCHHLYLLTAIVREELPFHKIVGICHNTDLRQMRKTGLRREFIARQIRKLDHILVPQKVQKQGVIKIYKADEAQISIVGVGYNNSLFYKREKVRESDQMIRLVFAGKIAEKKGVMSLIRSLSYLPYEKDRLVLKLAGGAGDEAEYRRIRELAKDAPYPVEFLGKLPQEELARVYNECDVFVLPSFFDSLPLALIEAAACGNRVVITELPGIRDWLTEHAPELPVRYVALPDLDNTDEADPQSLPAFEKELARRIAECAAMEGSPTPEMHHLSWKKICQRILEIGGGEA